MSNDELIAALCSKIVELNAKNDKALAAIEVLNMANVKLHAENLELRAQIAIRTTS